MMNMHIGKARNQVFVSSIDSQGAFRESCRLRFPDRFDYAIFHIDCLIAPETPHFDIDNIHIDKGYLMKSHPLLKRGRLRRRVLCAARYQTHQ
jgi:hypothetical protein